MARRTPRRREAGFRQLRNAPVFASIAAVTLALGIGANSAIFALVDATLLRPLPFGEPDRLVSIFETSAANPRSYVSPLNMIDWPGLARGADRSRGGAEKQMKRRVI